MLLRHRGAGAPPCPGRRGSCSARAAVCARSPPAEVRIRLPDGGVRLVQRAPQVRRARSSGRPWCCRRRSRSRWSWRRRRRGRPVWWQVLGGAAVAGPGRFSRRAGGAVVPRSLDPVGFAGIVAPADVRMAARHIWPGETVITDGCTAGHALADQGPEPRRVRPAGRGPPSTGAGEAARGRPRLPRPKSTRAVRAPPWPGGLPRITRRRGRPRCCRGWRWSRGRPGGPGRPACGRSPRPGCRAARRGG